MPPDTLVELSAYKAGLRRRVEVRAGDGPPLVVTWQPDRVTEDYLRAAATATKQLDALADRDDLPRALIVEIAERLILPLDTGWNLTEGGAPYPMTADTLAGLGILIVRAINHAIQTDAWSMVRTTDLSKARAAMDRTSAPLAAVGPTATRPKTRGDC